MTESYRHMFGAGLVLFLFCTGCGASARQPTPSGVSRIAAGHPPSSALKPDSSPRRHSTADVEFMQGMIGHHSQALTMAHMVPTHTDNARIHLLAQRIDVSQKDEIKQMQRWLEDRHEMVPDADPVHDHHDRMDHAVLMPGMLTPSNSCSLEPPEAPRSTPFFYSSRSVTTKARWSWWRSFRHQRRGPGCAALRLRLGRGRRPARRDRTHAHDAGCAA